MATYSAGDQINRALRLLGVLAEGETPSAATSQDSLMAMNQMIDSWNTERLSVFCTQDQVFNWPVGEISRTLGPSGDFVGNRPVYFDDATYYRDPGTNVSFGIKFINQQQYDGIAVKTVTSTYPQVIFVNMTFPNVEMFIYPRPTRLLEWHFVSVQELDRPADLSTTLYYPLVATPMIAPTKEYDGMPALSPWEAAQWMIDAARHRPVRIAPRFGVSARALDVVAPGVLNGILKQQRMQPN